jgi:hypothetical protein
MACGEPPAVATMERLLATCHEPEFPAPDPIVDPGPDLLEHAQNVIALSGNETGAVAEEAAARFLEERFNLAIQGAHGVTEHGVDHFLIDRSSQLVIAETKGTAGVNVKTQRSYRTGRPEPFATLLSREEGTKPAQGTDQWIERDPAMRQAELDAEAVSHVLGCRVDLLSESIDVWERNADGGWDHMGVWDCPTSDLVADRVGST